MATHSFNDLIRNHSYTDVKNSPLKLRESLELLLSSHRNIIKSLHSCCKASLKNKGSRISHLVMGCPLQTVTYMSNKTTSVDYDV
ncbi:hypothetical protein LguiA_003166 [Lonicera macranthoides]